MIGAIPLLPPYIYTFMMSTRTFLYCFCWVVLICRFLKTASALSSLVLLFLQGFVRINTVVCLQSVSPEVAR
jgi:hypothetical protein